MTVQQLLSKFYKGTYYNDNRSKQGIEFFHTINNNIPVFKFIGTNHWKDWVINFFYPSIKIPQGKVHSGWYGEFKYNFKIKRFLVDLVKHSYSNTIIVSGHSKGAISAILATDYLSQMFPHKHIDLYLFGSPKIANLKFKKYINTIKNVNIYNYQVRGDIVTKLPPNVITFTLYPIFLFLNLLFKPLLFTTIFFHVGKIIKIGPPKFITFKGHYTRNYHKQCN